MAVSEQTPYIEHTGNGVTTSFALEFQCESKDHLIVTVNGLEILLTAWSLDKGSVVFNKPPIDGSVITIQRNTPFNRTTDYQSFNNSFRPQSVNGDFDRLWLKLQELGVADWLMKLYVDRLHQQQEEKINNLKDYVDDRDDELRSYLMEEIRKQGVALDQLDEYYNYLMERLAQIAVDRGWEASFVISAGGETQQEINDSVGIKWRDKAAGYNIGDRVKTDTGELYKSIINSNYYNPNINKTGWLELETALSTKFSTLNKAINRVIADRFLERVSIKDFGAIGDGSLRTLQEWVDNGKFSGLAAIQVVMPFVTSLRQSIDWAATQYCLLNAKNIFIPNGKYVFSDVAKFPHNTTPFNVGTSAVAPRVFGDGVCTTITRNDERPATRIMNAEGTSTTQESDTANLNEACFSVHCPYAQISDLTIESSRVGIYFGQDFARSFTLTTASSVSKSSVNRVQINRCGTGVLMLAAGGNHYVDFSDMHFTSCQIDVHQRASFWWKITQGRGDANNNRNCFTRIRSGRSRVAYWNQCGDTNTLLEWHGEGVKQTAGINPYPVPDGLPSAIPNGSCMFVFDKFNQLNKVSLCSLEDVSYHVYNDGINNSFVQNLINEGLVKNIKPPREWFGRYVVRFLGYGYADNVYPDAFPELRVAGRSYFGLDSPNGTAIASNNLYHTPLSSIRGSYDTKFQVEFGPILAGASVTIPIWENIDSSSCAMINIDIVGRCDVAGQVSSFNNKVVVNAYRTSSRAITRFGMIKLLSSRATFEGIMDTIEANHITITVQKNSETPQVLEAVLTCPFDLSSGTAFICLQVMK